MEEWEYGWMVVAGERGREAGGCRVGRPGCERCRDGEGVEEGLAKGDESMGIVREVRRSLRGGMGRIGSASIAVVLCGGGKVGTEKVGRGGHLRWQRARRVLRGQWWGMVGSGGVGRVREGGGQWGGVGRVGWAMGGRGAWCLFLHATL